MTKILALIPLFLISTFGIIFMPGQPDADSAPIPICHTILPETDGMKQFALDPAFQALHLTPLPLDYEGIGKKITFTAPDGKDASGYFIKAKKKSDKWLFVYQEWWGLNDYIRRQSDTFYKDLGEDVNVLALDMYDGQSTDNPQEAGKLMSGTSETRLTSIVQGGYAYAGTKAQVASVGWCFGGGWSLRSALLGGKNNVGSVMYYGMPTQDTEWLQTLNSDVLGLFATEQRISKEVIAQFDANMKKAGKTLTYKIFPGVHGFANPSNPKFDEAGAKEAYGMALSYLKKRLKV
ncbi:dienelactone hydrolase family protein [Arundinibacter roseus]|uniref:Dienelactone hydrolase n=1 Tax=Arundinibacter roseus TaxID=2070510 RepID=A0A4R4K8X4_9BACT|nr:dienelactone hydrolase family protein [Arundinibacter roseus]TDB64128.1 dienelactone hydrolase [Arundinibacter roseus]